MQSYSLLLLLVTTPLSWGLAPCPGETRGDRYKGDAVLLSALVGDYTPVMGTGPLSRGDRYKEDAVLLSALVGDFTVHTCHGDWPPVQERPGATGIGMLTQKSEMYLIKLFFSNQFVMDLPVNIKNNQFSIDMGRKNICEFTIDLGCN